MIWTGKEKGPKPTTKGGALDGRWGILVGGAGFVVLGKEREWDAEIELEDGWREGWGGGLFVDVGAGLIWMRRSGGLVVWGKVS